MKPGQENLLSWGTGGQGGSGPSGARSYPAVTTQERKSGKAAVFVCMEVGCVSWQAAVLCAWKWCACDGAMVSKGAGEEPLGVAVVATGEKYSALNRSFHKPKHGSAM